MEKKINKLLIFAAIYFIGVYSAMYFCYKQPIDEHVNIINRELNFPKQDCYSESDIKLIIYGK
jgi:hypothetical protein|tara:strand:+ start:712 stop:900 length:189 start_codon:yes stop_codon:yes gene_type:complete